MIDGDVSTPLKDVLLDLRIYPSYAVVASLAYSGLYGLTTKVLNNSKTIQAANEEEDVKFIPRPNATVVAFKVVRLLACLVFLGAGVTKLLEVDDWHSNAVTIPVSTVVVSVYCSLLASINVVSKAPRQPHLAFNLFIVLVVSLLVYTVRDVWPLATYDRTPADDTTQWPIWTIIVSTFVGAIVVPLFVPQTYIPVDPKNPMTELHPEQEASLFSWIIFSYVDGTIRLANRIPHLSADQLPPLADYDRALYLRDIGLSTVDPLKGSKGRHLTWSLARVFAWPVFMSAFWICLVGVAEVLAPIGLNRLLNYLENGGEGATVRPWVWIFTLFIGPLTVALALQQYRFTGTRTIVRIESLITQLVFEHSLRIRMKAEVAEKSSSDSSATASKAPSITMTEGAVQMASATTNADTANSPGRESASILLEASTSSEESATHTAAPSEATTLVTSGAAKSKDSKSSKEGRDEKEEKNLVGRINNLITTDLAQIGGARSLWLVIAYAPLEIVLDIILLYNILGWSAFVGLALMLVMLPIPGRLTKLFHGVQKDKMKSTDARVETVTESLNILRMIKLFAWQGRISKRISDLREEELKHIWRRRMTMLAQDIVTHVIPILHMIATFAVYVIFQKQTLTASVVFSSIAVFELLKDQFGNCMRLIPNIIQAKVSLDRINEFLVKTELLDGFEPTSDLHSAMTNTASEERTEDVGFGRASFAWKNRDVNGTLTPSRAEYRLQIDEDLVFQKGKINLIVGPTGSGKTSMLMALLGEMHFIPTGPGAWFNLPRQGGIAYAAQESWVQNETIRENVLFGTEYDAARYKKVIHQCALERDLELFEAGDQTEVGEKGLTLSGGQKARLTLARAVYSNAQILLLDDILAALDVHTAKWIVDKCLSGDFIKGRTVILVTHNVALTTPLASFVVTLGIGGRIKSKGSVEDALAQDSTFRKIAEEQVKAETAQEDEETNEVVAPAAAGKLIVEEEIEMGRMDKKTLLLYIQAMSGRLPALFWVALVVGLLIYEAARAGQIWWLGNWANAYVGHDPSDVSVGFYLGIDIGIITTGVAFLSYSCYLQAEGSVRASRKIHQQLLDALLGTTLRWLDQTPVSRIITRCTQDIDALDTQIAFAFNVLIEISAELIVKLIGIFIFSPVFVIPGLIAAGIGAYIAHLYLRAQLPTKREMSKAKSPVIAHFGAAIAGITSIRAYGAQDKFRSKNIQNIDKYARTSSAYWNVTNWVSVRVALLGNLFSAALASYLIYGPASANPSSVGFSLNMSIAFNIMIIWWIRSINELEVQGNSLERIKQYFGIEHEPKPVSENTPPAYWPASGELAVEKLAARYSADGPKVLKDISFHIRSGERIGIVGRTGSGKSSLTLSLLRCILTEGEVYYDGIATSTLNLDTLRSNITIIPQMPELLSGTLRHNLDPFDLFEDATLNDILHSSGLNSIQKDEDDVRLTLDSQIASGGGNLSVGQRQIIALARAMLRKTKVLILDEATSAIDYQTDAVIQSSLRNEFKDVTLLTIAHRLQTIMDADRIMVMDAGNIAEFDRPSELLKNKDSLLRRLVDESSDKDILLEMAGAET